MVARAHPLSGLVVTFWRQGCEPETIHCKDAYTAWDHAVLMITRREYLLPGDCLIVRRELDVGNWPDDRFSDFPPEV